MTAEIIHGDCLPALRLMEADSVDAIVTDPPYGLSKEPDMAEVLQHWLAGDKYEHGGGGFMGKTWDSFVPGPEYWREAHRALKPGGYLLAFAGTRTWDLMSMAIRLGGFVNRDTVRHDFGPSVLGWAHGQGFPKGKAQLKPAWEPILMFRKPGPLRHLRIDECRVGTGSDKGIWPLTSRTDERGAMAGPLAAVETDTTKGRWPANFVMSHAEGCERVGTKRVKNPGGVPSADSQKDSRPAFTSTARTSTVHHFDADGTEEVPAYRCAEGCPVALMDEQSGNIPTQKTRNPQPGRSGLFEAWRGTDHSAAYAGEQGGASRFFHCFDPDPFVYQAKASRRDRGEGNKHPTVKSTALMRHLIRLVATPGDLVCDPFCGSGSTGVAALAEGCRFIGIEQDAESVETARRRCAPPASEVPQAAPGQLTLSV